eukprot:1192398-Prorocentrum_minimum.AAC.2
MRFSSVDLALRQVASLAPKCPNTCRFCISQPSTSAVRIVQIAHDRRSRCRVNLARSSAGSPATHVGFSYAGSCHTARVKTKLIESRCWASSCSLVVPRPRAPRHRAVAP